MSAGKYAIKLRLEGISSRLKQPKSSLLDDSILIIIIEQMIMPFYAYL